MRHTTPIFLLLLACLLLAWPLAAQARPMLQEEPTPAQVRINHVVLVPPEDNDITRPLLRVFFTVFDGDGHPVTNPSIDSVRVTIQNDSPATRGTYDFISTRAETPMYIALVLDASGSMDKDMEQVKEAAINAIRDAHSNAHFVVYWFSGDPTPHAMTPSEEDFFTTDARKVEGAIASMTAGAGTKGTCLYDAAYAAIRDLKREVPQKQARRAVILFTDGVDETGTPGEVCSTRKPPQVVREATAGAEQGESQVPIYTIGLCREGSANDPCTRQETLTINGETIEANPLKFMAEKSKGISAMGGLVDITGSFQEIMDGINSHILAEDRIYAAKGTNEATLEVRLAGSDTPLTAKFSFVSPIEYAPLPTASISSKEYHEEDDSYALMLDFTNPEGIEQLTIGVEDVAIGEQIDEKTFDKTAILAASSDDEEQNTPFVIEANGFEPEKKYCFNVRAKDEEGQLIPQQDTLGGEAHCVIYDSRIDYTIASARPDVSAGTITIDLDLDSDDDQLLLYKVSFIDAESNQPVDDAEPTFEVLNTSQLELSLPQQIRRSDEERDYIIKFWLRKDGDDVDAAREHPLRIGPLSFFQRVWNVVSSPYMLGGMGLLLVVVAVWLVYPKWRDRKKPLPKPQDIYNPTTIYPAKMQLVVKVTQTPDASQKGEKVIAEVPPDKPYTIGKATTASMRITGDTYISREHVQITQENNIYMLADLDSRNGTFINDVRQAARKKTPLMNKTIVRLGLYTYLEIEPYVSPNQSRAR